MWGTLRLHPRHHRPNAASIAAVPWSVEKGGSSRRRRCMTGIVGGRAEVDCARCAGRKVKPRAKCHRKTPAVTPPMSPRGDDPTEVGTRCGEITGRGRPTAERKGGTKPMRRVLRGGRSRRRLLPSRPGPRTPCPRGCSVLAPCLGFSSVPLLGPGEWAHPPLLPHSQPISEASVPLSGNPEDGGIGGRPAQCLCNVR